jgi:hypothetical protein
MTVALELEHQRADRLLADPLLHRVREAIRRRRHPCVHDPTDCNARDWVHVAGRDETEIASREQREQPAARLRRYVAHVDLAVVGAVSKEGLVEQQAERALALAEAGFKPAELGFLFGDAGSEELSVQCDDPPVAGVESPTIGAEEVAIGGEPREIERVVGRTPGRERAVADVVVAGDEPDRHGQRVEHGAGGAELVRVAHAVDRDVSEMNDPVGSNVLDPAGDDLPVSSECRSSRCQVRVRHENDPHGLRMPLARGSFEGRRAISRRRNASFATPSSRHFRRSRAVGFAAETYFGVMRCGSRTRRDSAASAATDHPRSRQCLS